MPPTPSYKKTVKEAPAVYRSFLDGVIIFVLTTSMRGLIKILMPAILETGQKKDFIESIIFATSAENLIKILLPAHDPTGN